MPTYVCAAAAGRLKSDQKAQIVRSITAIHHEETGAPRHLVQVIVYDVAPGSHHIAGRPALADQRQRGRMVRDAARFFAARLLPQTGSLLVAIRSGARTIVAPPAEIF